MLTEPEIALIRQRLAVAEADAAAGRNNGVCDITWIAAYAQDIKLLLESSGDLEDPIIKEIQIAEVTPEPSEFVPEAEGYFGTDVDTPIDLVPGTEAQTEDVAGGPANPFEGTPWGAQYDELRERFEGGYETYDDRLTILGVLRTIAANEGSYTPPEQPAEDRYVVDSEGEATAPPPFNVPLPAPDLTPFRTVTFYVAQTIHIHNEDAPITVEEGAVDATIVAGGFTEGDE